MKQVMTGNESAATAAKQARVKVVPAYPITPQTSIMEKLSEYVAQGELDAEFLKMESEHSVMSACIGAAAAGVRTFTATSSQGLLLMAEILFIASGLRMPLVMANVNRAVAAPLNILGDQTDSFALRDCGWAQIYCENAQEVFDTIIQAFRIAEEALVPVMVCYDGYILSHTTEVVDIPEQKLVDEFLPPYSYAYALDPERPLSIGAFSPPEHYMEFRHAHHEALAGCKEKVVRAGTDFYHIFGRQYDLMECYHSDDAHIVLVTLGSLAGTIKDIVDEYRRDGESVGMLKARLFRPFPGVEIVEALKNAKLVAVLEKDISPGQVGVLFTALAAAFMSSEKVPPLMISFVCGLGGRDVTKADLRDAVGQCKEALKCGEARPRLRWLGLKEGLKL